jgi:hypothetical protein
MFGHAQHELRATNQEPRPRGVSFREIRLIRRSITFTLLAASLWLTSCGGGTSAPEARSAASSGTAAATAAAAAAAMLGTPSRQQTLAAAAVDPADALDAANQLMDYAETWFPAYFPEHAATGSALGYTYRAYSSGIYLGVREGQVYVLGGAFGSEVLPVGALTDFIAPRPRVLSTLCAAAGATQEVYATQAAAVGRNAGVTLAGCNGAIASVRWQQTAGPAVPLPADGTQTLSFDPPQAGSYAFRADFTDASGVARSRTASLQVAAPEASATGLTVRASHSVRMGGQVSVRAWPTLAEGDSVKAVTWMQVEGPAVTLLANTGRAAFFTAPEVTRDTLVRLRATLHTTAGHMASDEVMVLVERQMQASPTDDMAIWAGEHVPRTYAYVSNGPFASVLRRCSYDPAMNAQNPYNLCSLATLPFLAQTTDGAVPSVEQVMARVLVSHDWLGRNFEAFLRTHDQRGDFRRMLNSVTTVVLSTHVRPSFYNPLTGTIYLDAESFWLTPEERDTVSETPDYRSSFGSSLQYRTLWRYVKDGQSIYKYADPTQRITRPLADVHLDVASLLYHELGHALDWLPPLAYSTLQSRYEVWVNLYTRYADRRLTSDVVPLAHPLTSQLMRDLGKVQFRGTEATAAQKALLPGDVAAAFSADLATDDYAYLTSFEDIAMTLEEVLMQRRLGIRRDFAINDAGGDTAASTIVRWGQRGRVGEPALRPRAKDIVQSLVPWLDPAEVDLLPAPIAMRPGESWKDNLQQPAIPRMARPKDAAPTLQEMAQFEYELRRMRQLREHGAAMRRVPGGQAAAALRR